MSSAAPISIDSAIATFVEGHCFNKSKTHPYEFSQIEGVWMLRDAPRKNLRDYRKEEWIACGLPPKFIDSLARKKTRGRYFICAILRAGEEDAEMRAQYKSLGYRLIGTEPFFVHTLKRIPKIESPAIITRVTDDDLAAQLGKASRSKPLLDRFFADDSRLRQYVALVKGEVVGWVASIRASEGAWCSNMYVMQVHRRRGIGGAMLERMLRDLKKAKTGPSVLLASHTGALLYPKLGYEQIGKLYIYAPPRSSVAPRL